MSAKHDDERRWVEVEVEVPGTPEEVWRAIATGPGISSWFVPSEVEERVGGTAKCDFGPGMESISTVTAWEPPRLMGAESQDLGPDAPPVATEWIVEARDGGTCVVRVVHSLFTTSSDWDNELEAWEGGWPDFFRILRLYLTHYAGQRSALLQLSAMTSSSPAEAWAKLGEAAGVAGIGEGEDRSIDMPGMPALGLHVERVGGDPPHAQELLMRSSGPMTGITHWFTLQMGEQTVVSVRFYVYGVDAKEKVQAREAEWGAWMSELFPTSG